MVKTVVEIFLIKFVENVVVVINPKHEENHKNLNWDEALSKCSLIKWVCIRAVESGSREVGKSLKIGKNRIKSEKSDLISY